MTARQARGFTLLEVLVAMAVLAVGMGALLKSAGGSAGNLTLLRERTFAGWVAANKANEALLTRGWPATGTSDGVAEMAGAEWRWELRVSDTPNENIRRLDVAVRGTGDEAPLVVLGAYKARPRQ